MTKRLMTWLLALAMVFTMLPMPARAEELPQETVPETVFETVPEAVSETIPETVAETAAEAAPEAEADALPAAERFTATIPFRVNPLYEGLYEPAPEDIPQFPEKPEYSPQAVTYKTVDQACKDVRTNMKNRTESYTVYVKSTSSDYNAVFNELLTLAMEHTGTGTEGDYLMWHLSGYGASLGYDYSGGYYNYTYNITTTYYTTAAQEKELTTAVNKLINSLGVRYKTDYEKVCAVYDYMCANISYDYANLEDETYGLKFSAYAALVNKTAVCQGYALLFYRLMLELGVDTRFIGGDGGGPHAWNIVQLGDYYYNVDATWDAGYADYDYFLKSAWTFGNHYRDPEFDYWEFHMDHPMAGEDYVHGGTATLDPYINMGYCGTEDMGYTNAAWAMMRDGTLVIEGEGAMYDYSSDSAPYYYYWIDHIEKAEIGEGITSIGNYCFYKAPALAEVSLPETLTDMGDSAFYGCGKLESVEFPGSLSEIPYRTFCYCSSLTEVVCNEGVTKIDTGAFEGCTSLNKLVLPDSLVTIAMDAFRGCNALTEVTIPENVVNVTGFQECDNLLTVYINGQGSIGSYAFYGCDKLENVVIGDKITYINSAAFQYCKGLKELTIPATVVNIAGFDNCTGLETLVLNNTGDIENYAFNGCTSLKNLTITNATSIGHMAFQSAAITSVEIPATVTRIDYGAFGGNRSLKEIYFLGDVPTIDSNTFYYVTATAYYPYGNETWTADKLQNYGGTLTWVAQKPENIASGTWGDNISWVLTFDGTLIVSGEGEAASASFGKDYPWYAYAEQIKKVIFEEGVTNVPEHAFAFSYPNLESVELKSVEIIDYTTFTMCESLTTVILPDTLKEIRASAFAQTALEEIQIFEGVTLIGSNAFMETKLREIVLPDGLLELGDAVFDSCKELKSAYLPDSITAAGMNLFSYCSALETANIPKGLTYVNDAMFSGSGLKEIEIPEGITWLGMGCFQDTALTSVTIPATVTWIDYGAFGGNRSLTEIHFLGDVPNIDSDTFYYVTATAYYPYGNETWTADKLQNYGGTLTWVEQQPENIASGTWGDNISWVLNFDGTLIVSGAGEVAESKSGNPYPWKAYADQIIKVIFEEGVTNVPVSAFEYAYPNLVNAELKSVEIIGSTAFAQCTALTSVILPDTLKEIDNGAFSDTGFTTIEIHEGVTRIGLSAFSCSKLTEIVLPEGLVELGDSAFSGCEDLKSVHMPDSVTDAGLGVFLNCFSLETANISKGLTFVNDMMFIGCPLKEIEIPEGITWLGMGCFQGAAITSVTIPASVTMISSSFEYCTELKEITFLGDAPEMGAYSFTDVTATAYYPAGNATWTEEIRESCGSNITWVPYGEPEEEYYVKWVSGATSLNGTIDMLMFVILSDNLVENPDTYIRFTFENRVVDVPMADAEESIKNGVLRYRIACPLFAKQLGDEAVVQVMVGDTPVGKAQPFSVKEYCMYFIEENEDPVTAELCRAMLNYGAAAQLLLDYKADQLVNSDLSDEDKILADVDASAYQYAVTGSEPGIRARGAQLTLEADVRIRVNFTLEAGRNIEDYTFTINGVKVQPKQGDNCWYIVTEGIPAKDLEEMYDFSVGGINVHYGALSFVNTSIIDNDDPELVNFAKALYAYYVAAEALLG